MESRDKAGHEEQRLHKDARAQCRGGTGQKSQGVQHVPFSFVSVSLSLRSNYGILPWVSVSCRLLVHHC